MKNQSVAPNDLDDLNTGKVRQIIFKRGINFEIILLCLEENNNLYSILFDKLFIILHHRRPLFLVHLIYLSIHFFF